MPARIDKPGTDGQLSWGHDDISAFGDFLEKQTAIIMADTKKKAPSSGSEKASTTKTNTDPNKPSSVLESPIKPIVLDYTTFSDVDHYIEFAGYKYQRFINAASSTEPPIVRIRMPLIGPIQSGYQMNFSQGDVALTYDLLMKWAANFNIGFTKESADQIASIGGVADQTGFNILSNAGEFRTPLSNALGKTINGRQESSFVSIGMRNHSFDWMLIPRKADEARMILDIVQTFKQEMHPESSEDNAFLFYPTEWTIAFYTKTPDRKSVEPLNLPKIPDCSISSFNVTYNPNGAARFHEDNSALGYRISIAFIEGQQLTKKDIINGGY